MAKPIISVQVRELVEFALREGDLGGKGDFVGSNRALAGTRGHQRVQRSRPAEYQKEIRLSYDVTTDEFILRIQGRLDGLLATEAEVLLEEIKTIQGNWEGAADPLHWAQVKVYGFIYAHDHGLEHITLRLTYLHLDTGKVTQFLNRFMVGELSAFFKDATAIYLDWVRQHQLWCQERDQSIRGLAFPFQQYRPGQRALAVAAYRALVRGKRLFLEAPTGIGKTISVLYPALKALAEDKLERIFYLTARTTARAVAEKAFSDLREAGLHLRSLTLTAKDKICLQQGQPCDPQTCPLARGYYDRRRPAMRAALAHGEITRPVLEAFAQEHQVCPFELSLDLSLWVDAVVCDYNYVFDPRVYLRRPFEENNGNYVFLVDEAHNLVDRARDMFSADLSSQEIDAVRRAIRKSVPRCAKALGKLSVALGRLGGLTDSSPVGRRIAVPPLHQVEAESATTRRSSFPATDPAENNLPTAELNLFPAKTPNAGTCTLPSDPGQPFQRREDSSGVSVLSQFPIELVPLLAGALQEAETWLARNEPAEFRSGLLELYFRLYSFGRAAERYDSHYRTISVAGSSARVRLFCLDPSYLLRQALTRGKAAVFFSATLTPIEYYRDLLGGGPEDPVLQLASPFPPENLAVLVQDGIRTHFKDRAGTLSDVAEVIGALVQERCGNYLVYLPSYQYLTNLKDLFQRLHPTVPILAQRPGMTEAERESFLEAFAAERNTTQVGFAVLGGVFGEGIDLVGDRLIGAVIVGVGLPQLCTERDLIRQYFEEKLGRGFDYAYMFPGMNRVLQAIGRVIRSETDRGAVLLVDTRFGEQRYRWLFPSWWRPERVRSLAQVRAALRKFWNITS